MECQLLQKNPKHKQMFVQHNRNFMTACKKQNLVNLDNTKRAKICRIPTDEKAIQETASAAAKILSDGQVIAVPTDTVYGLAALVQNSAAVQQLYHIKGTFQRLKLILMDFLKILSVFLNFD